MKEIFEESLHNHPTGIHTFPFLILRRPFFTFAKSRAWLVPSKMVRLTSSSYQSWRSIQGTAVFDVERTADTISASTSSAIPCLRGGRPAFFGDHSESSLETVFPQHTARVSIPRQ